MTSSPALLSRFLRAPYVGHVPRPEPGAGELQVKTVAVALNPTDYKLPPLSLPGGKIVGCDYAGIVTKVGPGVKGFVVGDRVSGVVHGGKSDRAGAFSEYLVGPASATMVVPASLSLEQAATFPVALITSALVLHQYLGYPIEGLAPAKGFLAGVEAPLLVWSAATTTGQMLVQLSKVLLPQVPVFTTSSPSNFAKLRALGADHTFDYNDADVVAKIREAASQAGFPDGIRRAYDAYSEGSSSGQTAQCLTATASKPAFLVKSLPYLYARMPAHVHHEYVFAYTAMGKAFNILFLHWKQNLDDHAVGTYVFNTASRAWFSRLKAPEVVHINDQGGAAGAKAVLEAIRDEGLPLLQSGKIRGGKIVARFGPDPSDQ